MMHIDAQHLWMNIHMYQSFWGHQGYQSGMTTKKIL